MKMPAHTNHFGACARRLASLWLLAAAAPGWADGQQASPPARTPDVHFVPTDTAVVRAMLEAARVGRNDLVYDLGCGDGRIVITAVKRHGARGVCVDIDPVRIKESRYNADTAGVISRMKFRRADLFETDLRPATVVTLYLLPQLNERLRPKLFRELQPGSRVVSNAFDMGEWKADRVLTVPNVPGGFTSFAYFWVMPANVAGTWKVSVSDGGEANQLEKREYEVRFDQRFQQVTGTAALNGRDTVPVTTARLVGDSLAFALGDSLPTGAPQLRFTGRVKRDRITGKVAFDEGGTGTWSAVRTEPGRRPELELNAAAGGSPRP
jgi:SAM-dependent methyltransferase